MNYVNENGDGTNNIPTFENTQENRHLERRGERKPSLFKAIECTLVVLLKTQLISGSKLVPKRGGCAK